MLRSRFGAAAVMTGVLASLCVGFASTGEARTAGLAGQRATPAQVRPAPEAQVSAWAMVHGLRLIERLP